MTELALFVSAFGTVFSLGFQQQNVLGRHFVAAGITSFVIGACQIYLWRTLPDSTASEIVATLLGGPVGIIAAMWTHPVVMRKTGKRAASQ